MVWHEAQKAAIWKFLWNRNKKGTLHVVQLYNNYYMFDNTILVLRVCVKLNSPWLTNLCTHSITEWELKSLFLWREEYQKPRKSLQTQYLENWQVTLNSYTKVYLTTYSALMFVTRHSSERNSICCSNTLHLLSYCMAYDKMSWSQKLRVKWAFQWFISSMFNMHVFNLTEFWGFAFAKTIIKHL